MATLTNTKIKDTYDGLLKTTDNDALGGTYKLITDGLGNSSNVYLGTGGNVGIGESTPSKPLTINKNQSETAILVQSSDTGTAGIYIGGQSDSIKGGLILDNSDDSLQLRGYNNANRLHVKSDGNIGIGTNQPQTLVQLSNNNSSTNSEQGAISFSGDTATRYSQISGFRFNNSNQAGLDFKVYNGSLNNAMRIKNDGNVGIGTTDPTKLLHIASQSAQSVITLQRTNTNTTGAIGALQWTALDNHTVASMVALGDGNNEGADITFNTTSAASSEDPYGISERMRINSSGNVGIGTGANVDEILHIQGSVDNDDIALKIENTFDDNSSATPPSAAVVFTTASNNGHIRVFGAPANTAANHKMDIGATASTSYLTFSPNGSEKMRIDSSGNVGIGTSSPALSTAYDRVIHIHSTLGSLVKLTDGGTGSTANDGTDLLQYSSDFYIINRESGTIRMSTSSSERMRITNTGRIHFYNLLGSSATQSDVRYDTTSKELFYNTSSERYKTDIVDLENTLDKVNSLRAVRYKDIETEQETTGLIAEEVIQIIPEVVFKKEIEGFDEPQPEGINYSDFAPFLIKAIQELKAEIETLKSQINS